MKMHTGTAGYMDWAALFARSRGASFWKAFTTGKPTALGGIPHDLVSATFHSTCLESVGVRTSTFPHSPSTAQRIH